MSRNKETANYEDLKVQLTRCMEEIKHKSEEQKEYNMPKFAQILVGDEYIKELRKKHREKEWKIFWPLYVQEVLKEYAPDEARKLLLAVNGFLEEYRDLNIKQRLKKYADEIERTPRTVQNREKTAIKLVVQKLYDEIQQSNRRELKILADEAFAKLDGAKPDDEINEYESKTLTDDKMTSILPLDVPEVAEGSSDKPGKVPPDGSQAIKRLQQRQNIVTIVVIILAIGIAADWLHGYLSTRMARNEEEAAPLISDILVITPEIQLYPGKEGIIQLDVAPDGADIDSVNCIPDDPGVATVDHRIVTAQDEWQEEDHETQIRVQGGVSPDRQVHVTVLPDPREQFTGADRPDGKPTGKEGKEGEQ